MNRVLNARLKFYKHGEVAPSVVLAHWQGPKEHVGRVYVYWPFVTFEQTDGEWNITHAMTGRFVHSVQTLAAARTVIRKMLRRHDFIFHSPTGRKATAAKRSLRGIVPPLVRIG